MLNRSPLKWKFFRLFSTRVKFCEIPYANFEATSRFLSNFCIYLQFYERLFLCTFLAQTIYTLLNRSPLKWKFLRLSSAQVKFCQISYANFETVSRFLSKFCIPLQFHERLLLCSFLAQTICTLLNRSPLKWKSLRLSNARVKIHQIPHVNFELTSQFLFKFCNILDCMTHNSSVDFKLILFLLWIKGSHQYPNFETLSCSDLWSFPKLFWVFVLF